MEPDLRKVADEVHAIGLDMYTPLKPFVDTPHFAADGIHPEGGAQKVIAEITAKAVSASVATGTVFGAMPVGDGVTDDTAAIQALLDEGRSCVYLPPPKDHYLISKTLKIGSGQELRLDRFTRVRLAPQSNCPMLENRCYRAGAGTNVFVAVTGGVWDMDNRNQRPNFMQVAELAAAAPKKHDPDFFFGMAIRFCHLENLTVRGVTIRNPSNYGIEFGHVSYVTADDVTFDYREGNPFRLNMDGLHFDGHSHHLRLSNIRGSCFDDMVALNANDGMCSPEEGPISDVTIDGLYCEYCHSGVRLLSADAPVSHVTIRNIHGNFYISAVWLTHHFQDRPAPGRFDDIVITDVFAGKALPPPEVDCPWRRGLGLVHLQGNSNIGNLVLERIYRDEKTLPSGTLVCDSPDTVIENLVIRDSRMTNRLAEPAKFLDIKGKVQKLVNENNTFFGAWEK